MKYAILKWIEPTIMVVTFSDFDPTEEQFEEYLKEMDAIYKNNSGFVIIFDGSKAKYLSSKLRIRQGKWMKDNNALIKEKCMGHIYMITSKLTSFLLKAIFVVQSPPIQHAVVSNMDDAREKARNFLG